MGWPRGLEPPTLGITIRCSNQLSYGHHKDAVINGGRLRVNENEGLQVVDAWRLMRYFDGTIRISYTYRELFHV